MAYHAKLSPSSASRWSSCTASIKEQEGLPDSSSEAARKGTAEHLAAEECLKFGLDPQDFLGRVCVFPKETGND